MGLFNLGKPLPSIELECTSVANKQFEEPVTRVFAVDKHVQVHEVGGITEVVVDDDPASPYKTKLPRKEVVEKINIARGIAPRNTLN